MNKNCRIVLIGKNRSQKFGFIHTLVYRIDVHACLLILREKSTLYGLILDCTFIDFEGKFPPVRLFHPARLLILVIHQQSLEFMVTFWGKTSIFCKFKPLDSHESAVSFKMYPFFLIQRYKYTLFQSYKYKNFPLHVYYILHV